MGLEPAPVSVAVRTGDTSPSQRAQMLKRRPNLVVTTPESLYLMLTSARGREALCTVETVIVDEIHAVARDKRGAHLALSLERLEALCERQPVRIGLCATQRPIERRRPPAGRGSPAASRRRHRPPAQPRSCARAARRRARGGRVGGTVWRRRRSHRRARRAAPHHAGVRQYALPGRTRRASARRAPGGRCGRRRTTAACPRTAASASRPACARASSRPWSRPPRSSSASTSVRSSWCARSARREASPPSCSASVARTTVGWARQRVGCFR